MAKLLGRSDDYFVDYLGWSPSKVIYSIYELRGIPVFFKLQNTIWYKLMKTLRKYAYICCTDKNTLARKQILMKDIF